MPICASTTHYSVVKPNGGNGMHRSGNTGRSPRDRNVRATEALSEPSLLDDDSSPGVVEDKIVSKLNGECIAGCSTEHDACTCPNLTGDQDHQKKTFASLSTRRKFLPAEPLRP